MWSLDAFETLGKHEISEAKVMYDMAYSSIVLMFIHKRKEL